MELFFKYPHEVQDELLMYLIQKGAKTEYGQSYGFESLSNYDDFARNVPVGNYTTKSELIERTRSGESNVIWPSTIKWFAKSSGTSNSKSKFIPVSPEALEDCHYAASKDLLCVYLHNHPDSELFIGKNLRLGGSKKLYKDKGTVYGDLSAILIDNMPFWAEFSSTPSNEVSLLSDWEVKLQAIVEETIKERVSSLAGVPSWMLVLLNEVLETTGAAHLHEIWPELEVYFHGGVNFDPYKDQYKNLLPKSDFRYYEIYNASEGFFAIQDRNDSDELLLMLDYGIFYEFIPFQPNSNVSNEKVIPLSNVELGINYAVVITTNAGLWRYQIGDTIRFTSLSPYRIQVTGRTKHHINAFGEELIIDNAEKAIGKVCAKTKSIISNYTAAPIFMEEGTKGAHEWIIEFEKAPENLTEFSIQLDLALQNENSDYEAKRYKNMTLLNLKLHTARKDLFYDWHRRNEKLGGQNKVPRLSNSRTLLEELLEMNR